METVAELVLKACAFATVPVIAAAVTAVLRELRRRRRTLDGPDAPGCIACGETDVSLVAEGVYVCPSCGYEGGPGHAAWLAAEQRRRLGSLPEPERLARAEAALEEASSLAVAASMPLRDVEASLPRWETTSGNSREARPWESELLRALGDVAQAFARLQEAAACLDRQAPAPPDVHPELWQTQLGEIDVVCVLEDVRLAREATSNVSATVKRWRTSPGS